MDKLFLKKLFNIISALAIISQSLTPYAVLLPQTASAQEVTDQTTVDQSTPTNTVTPAPDQTIATPTEEVTPAPTDVPTDTINPAPQETTTPTDTPTVDNNSPPSTDNSGLSGDTTSVNTDTAPTATINPTQEGLTTSSSNDDNGQLNLIILDNASAPSVDLDAVVSQGSAALTTDKPDYAPTDTALITGSNLTPNTTYSLRVWSDDAPATSTTANVTTDDNGVFAYAYQLDGTYRPNYSAELKDSAGNVVASTTFTDANPSADLDQCANDPAPSAHTDGCSASSSDWVNGNLGASKSVYLEGDSIPYRMRFDNLGLSPAPHNVIIEWDTAQGGKHATDYLTSFDRTVATANPCLGVSGCNPAAFNTFAIPSDPQVTGGGVIPVAGFFKLYGGTITGLSVYTYPDGSGFAGNKTARITITFTASVANPVLAWGGHIATRADWGTGNSAIDISGSPYHMRLIDLDGSGGNQDRSLSADAVVFPGSITIIKIATPSGSTTFPFIASPSPLSNFNLIADGTSANTKVFSNITNFQTYSVSETTPAAWSLNSIICGVTSANGGSQTVTLPGVSISLKEGENVTCTFANSQDQGSIELKKSWIGTAGQTTLNIGTSAGGSQVASQLTGASGAAPLTTGSKNVNTGTYYVSETGGLTNYSSVLACTDNGQAVTPGANNSLSVAKGHTVVCTFTNTRNTGSVQVNKLLDNDGNGTFETSNPASFNWSLDGSGTNAMGSTVSNVDTGSHSINENSVTNYHLVGWYLTSDTQHSCTNPTGTTLPTNVSVTTGQTASITICNARDTGTIELKKVWSGTGGQTTLKIGTTAGASDVDSQLTGASGAAPLTTGSNTVATGTYFVSETGGLTDYGSVLSCTDNGQSVTPGANNSVSVTTGHAVVCTFTNTRNTGTLRVLKNVDLNGDGDYTDANETGATDWKWQANGGSDHNTGDTAITVDTGNYALTETNKTNFHFVSLGCTGGTLNSNTVTVTSGANVVCTFTNARDTGSVKVNKLLDNDGNGTFELINPNIFTWKLDGGADNQMGGTVNNVPTGSHNVTENSVNNYHYVGWYVGPTNSTQFSCSNPQTLNTTALPAGVTVVTGQTAEITICNQRDTGTIELKKVWSGTGGQTTLNIGTTEGTSNVDTQLTGTNGGAPLTTGQNTVPTDTYYVSETGGLTNYSSVLACTDNGQSVTPGSDGSVSVTTGHAVVCTFTNTRNQGTIIVKKVMVGGTNTFSFTGTPNGSISVNNGTIQATVDTGSYSSTEAAKSGWDLTSVVCDDNNSTGDKDTRTATFNVEKGETVTCTFTNTKRGHIVVDKVTYPSQDSQSFNFNTSGSGYNGFSLTDQAAPNDQEVLPGSYSVSEEAVAGWASDGGVCDKGETPESLDVEAGETVTCTFTNNKPSAQIDLTPLTATNKIADNHVITANVQVQNGNGVWGPAANGTTVTFSITNSNGATADFVPSGTNSCTTTAGSCSVTINSPTAGHVEVHASASPEVLGVTLSVSTGSGGENSRDAQKDYVNARISITPHTSTNEVNDDHEFIVKVEKSVENGVWTPVQNAVANAIVSPSTSLDVSDCNSGTDVNGECTVTVNSSNAGVFTITARSTVTVNGVIFKLQTNGQGENSSSAQKTYVDASIALSPQEATNNVNDPHTITVHVTKNDGSGVTDAEGVTVTFSITSGTADFVGNDNDCVTDSNGLCFIQIVDDTPGVNTIDATTTFSVDGVSLTRSTNGNEGPNGTDSAEKTYVGGKIIVQKVTQGGDDNFTFHTSYSDDFELSNGESNESVYLAPGAYNVSEDVVAGWDLTSAVCDNQQTPDDITLTNGDIITCTFTNTKRGKVIVTKYNDLNGDGNLDEGEGVLSDWTINLDDLSKVTDENGQVEFDDVLPGGHSLSENLKDGWEQTALYCDNQEIDLRLTLLDQLINLQNNMSVSAGETVNCSILNHNLAPKLTISKENDTLGNPKAQGDTVTYTLTVTLDETGGPAKNLTVTDLLPEGFTYVGGSYQVFLNGTEHTGDYGEPTYHSPGVWSLGDANPGDVFKLIYKATVGNVAAGTYYDNAWAQANPVGSSDVILASAVNPGQLDSTFVGTEVLVQIPPSGTGFKANVTKDVLGASTFLPATGEDTLWVIIASLLGLTGLTTLFAGIKLRKKNWYEK